MTWDWPQITMVLLYALGLIVNYVKDGQPKQDLKYNFKAHVIAVAFSAGLLWAGGFWGQ